MAEYIDRNELEVDTEWDDYYDGYTSYSQLQINNAPTINAIPLDKIKQAREEMLDSKFHGKTVLTYNDAINDCVKILDKLIGESEE